MYDTRNKQYAISLFQYNVSTKHLHISSTVYHMV